MGNDQKIVVLEGLYCTYKSTIAKKLEDEFGIKFVHIDSKKISKIPIEDQNLKYITGDIAKFFLAKLYLSMDKWSGVCFERWYFSTLSYAYALDEQSFDNLLSFVKSLIHYDLLGSPYIVFFLDIDPVTSINRQMERNVDLSNRKLDVSFLNKMRDFYLNILPNVFDINYVIINGENKTSEEIFEEIEQTLYSTDFFSFV